MAVAADFILAAALLNVVRKSRHNFQREEPFLDIAVVYLINTGTSTATVVVETLAELALFAGALTR